MLELRRIGTDIARMAGAVAAAVLTFAFATRAEDIRQPAAWPPGVGPRPLEQRVGPPPEALVRHLREDNRQRGFHQVPRAAQADASLAADIRQAIASMPEAVRRLVAPKLIGVFTVRDLGSTAWAEHVRGDDGTWQRGVVALDLGAIDRRANTWFSWREGTPFHAEPGFAIVGRIADDDSRVAAIRYILLHEFAHVASIGEDYLPDWDAAAPEDVCAQAYVCLSWRPDGQSRYDDLMPERGRIAYYRPPDRQLPAARAAGFYAGLARTDFVSLYAATSPHEDFAEAVANYVHVQLMGLPYRIEVRREGHAVATVADCWREERCVVKRRFIERLLGLAGD